MKRYLTLLLFVCILLTVTAVIAMLYAFKIEPYRLAISKFTLHENLDSRDFITIVQISDLHIKEDFTYENLRKVVDMINQQQADIVVFSGDLYDHYARYHDDDNIISELQNIKAAYMKLAVWGNRDYGGGALRHYESIMRNAGFDILKNENRSFISVSGKQILFSGLDDAMLGNPNLERSYEIETADYAILLMHEPDLADYYLSYGYDFMLAGHSHGGQINLPLFPFINEATVSATALSSTYSSGMYNMNDHNESKMYVNTGIGTTHISARFGVVPEIAVFYVYI